MLGQGWGQGQELARQRVLEQAPRLLRVLVLVLVLVRPWVGCGILSLPQVSPTSLE